MDKKANHTKVVGVNTLYTPDTRGKASYSPDTVGKASYTQSSPSQSSWAGSFYVTDLGAIMNDPVYTMNSALINMDDQKVNNLTGQSAYTAE